MNPICRTVIGKLHHRLPSISPHPRSFSNSSACDKESGLKRCFSASASCLTHCTVADTTSTSTKRDQPADTNGSDSSSKKQKVEEETPKKMSALRLGSVAPDFEAKTTQGPIKFHDFIDGSWTILFSCVHFHCIMLFPLARLSEEDCRAIAPCTSAGQRMEH